MLVMGARRPFGVVAVSPLPTSRMSDIECAFALGRQGCVGTHRHPWVVGTRGRCGDSGGRSPSLVEGGDGGLSSYGPGVMRIVMLKIDLERSTLKSFLALT